MRVSGPSRSRNGSPALSEQGVPPVVDVKLQARPTAASQARRSLTVLLGDLPEQTYEDLLILVSELVTNSVRHSGEEIGAEVRVRLGVWISGSCLRAEVVDTGPGFEKFVRPSSPDQLGGWGLQLVDRLSDCWGVRRSTTHGSAVWFEIDLNRSRRTNLR